MPAIQIEVHPTQFPDRVRLDLLRAIEERRFPSKFHYDTVKQSMGWLALHEAFSPARRDPNCLSTYDQAFERAAVLLESHASLHLVGLGSGGAQKEQAFLERLAGGKRELTFTCCEASVPLAITSARRIGAIEGVNVAPPIICDLSSAPDLADLLQARESKEGLRVATCFGLLPNLEPENLCSLLRGILRKGDYLLISANLAPGSSYDKGIEQVLPQYDNPLTREWLLMALSDLGVESGDGRLRFEVGASPHNPSLKRIQAKYRFAAPRALTLDQKAFRFRPDDEVDLFFSYRYTPELVSAMLRSCGLTMLGSWITASGEEGVFLCQRHP